MASGRGIGRKGGEGDDEDRLPWLEPADIDYDDEPVLARKWIVLGAGVFIVALVSTVSFIYSRADDADTMVATGNGEPPLIAAPAEPFRQRPENPAGAVAGEGLLLDHLSQGGEPGGEPQLGTAPEQPVARPAPEAPPVAAAAPSSPAPAGTGKAAAAPTPSPSTPAAVKPVAPGAAAAKAPPAAAVQPASPPKPERKPANPVYLVQLGAFSTVERAQAGWIEFSQKYDELKGLSADIQPVSTGAKTMYRLRGGSISYRPKAESICGKLKAAGQPCIIVEK